MCVPLGEFDACFDERHYAFCPIDETRGALAFSLQIRIEAVDLLTQLFPSAGRGGEYENLRRGIFELLLGSFRRLTAGVRAQRRKMMCDRGDCLERGL